MTVDHDSMVITPRINPRDRGPRRRAVEARKTERTKRQRSSILRRLRHARRLQSARTARAATKARQAAGAGSKAARRVGLKRVVGGAGIALLVMDAINAAGSTVRRAEGGVSGRLLDAMDQDAIYGQLDELATGAARGRESIESDETLLRIIGIQGRVNSQIGQLGAWFRERATARAIGSDLIEREPGFDHLGSVADKALAATVGALKTKTDEGINAIRSYIGKGPIER